MGYLITLLRANYLSQAKASTPPLRALLRPSLLRALSKPSIIGTNPYAVLLSGDPADSCPCLAEADCIPPCDLTWQLGLSGQD